METQLKSGRAAIDQLREERANRAERRLQSCAPTLSTLKAAASTEVNAEAAALRADAEIASICRR